MPFDPSDWVRRFRANGDEGRANSYMDSGWSSRVADRCEATTRDLLFELFGQLRSVPILPADFFDRPVLAAVLTCVHESHL